MKKFLTMTLVFVALLSLCACSGKNDTGDINLGDRDGGNAVAEKYDHGGDAGSNRNKAEPTAVTAGLFFSDKGDSLPDIAENDFDERYLADEDVDGTTDKIGKYYAFTNITYSAGMGITYSEPLKVADGDVWNTLHGLTRYEDKAAYMAEFEEYAASVISTLDATGDFDPANIYDDEALSIKGCDIFAISEDGSVEFSVNADYDGYQSVTFDTYFYRYHADALTSSLDTVFDNITKYTGILFAREDFDVTIDVIDRNSVQGGGIIVRIEDPETFDGVEVSVVDYGLNTEMWHISAMREVQKWPAFE